MFQQQKGQINTVLLSQLSNCSQNARIHYNGVDRGTIHFSDTWKYVPTFDTVIKERAQRHYSKQANVKLW